MDFGAISDDEQACRAAEAAGVDLEGCKRTWGWALYECFDQRGRFEHEIALRNAGDGEAGMMDEGYITTLEYGLPPAGGIGIGRCVMLLTGSNTIWEVILFPTVKPLD